MKNIAPWESSHTFAMICLKTAFKSFGVECGQAAFFSGFHFGKKMSSRKRKLSQWSALQLEMHHDPYRASFFAEKCNWFISFPNISSKPLVPPVCSSRRVHIARKDNFCRRP